MATLGYGETLGVVVEGRTALATLSLHRSGEHLAHHEHGVGYICIVISGRFCEATAKGELERGPNDALVHEPGASHSDRFGRDGAVCLNLHPAGPQLQAGPRQLSPALTSTARGLAAQLMRREEQDDLDVEALVAELLDDLGTIRASRRDNLSVARVVEALDDVPERSWTLTELATIAERHPNHLARAFRNCTGLSLGAYRRRNRLTRLCADLRSTDLALSEIAQIRGYADQAHMTREFRRFIGSTPAAYRRRSR